MQNRTDQARQIYAQMHQDAAANSIPEPPGMSVLRLLIRGLIEMAEHKSAAERSLREAVEIQEQIPVFIVYASARVMLAHLYLESNRPQAALAEFEPVLARCEQQEIPGLILKEGSIVVPLLRLAIAHNSHSSFAARLLALLGVPPGAMPARVPETGEMLTPREVEILRLIVAGCSNREIAARLVVSEPTVKTHVAHILQKLNVSSRTQAAARARDLHLV
jgi:LuxR family maltose regulon positive regulatory protein